MAGRIVLRAASAIFWSIRNAGIVVVIRNVELIFGPSNCQCKNHTRGGSFRATFGISRIKCDGYYRLRMPAMYRNCHDVTMKFDVSYLFYPMMCSSRSAQSSFVLSTCNAPLPIC